MPSSAHQCLCERLCACRLKSTQEVRLLTSTQRSRQEPSLLAIIMSICQSFLSESGSDIGRPVVNWPWTYTCAAVRVEKTDKRVSTLLDVPSQHRGDVWQPEDGSDRKTNTDAVRWGINTLALYSKSAKSKDRHRRMNTGVTHSTNDGSAPSIHQDRWRN